MKCKDFRIEVEEGLKGESLSIIAQDHAAGCAPCHEFNQKHVEFREWLMVCEKITAPKDFQFGVQRKIAGGQYAHSHGWAWSRLQYIVPSAGLAAVLVLVGSYLFNYQNVSTDPAGPTAYVAESENRNPETAKDEAVPSTVVVQPENSSETQKPGDEKTLAAANVNKQNKNAPAAIQKEGPGGSLDSTVKEVKDPKTPKGINLAQEGPVQSRLLQLGVITGRDSSGLIKVSGFTKKSSAAGSGVKVGDTVEGLNGNVLTVKRGGQALQITIQ